MTMPEGPSRATSTTLRAPPKALVVGEVAAVVTVGVVGWAWTGVAASMVPAIRIVALFVRKPLASTRSPPRYTYKKPSPYFRATPPRLKS